MCLKNLRLLLSSGRGKEKTLGEFRRSQNWSGGSRPGNVKFAPPPPDQMNDGIGDLELFLHNQPVSTPPLIKAALVHVQFETIHPFLDGNGRLGRLLILLILFSEGLLSNPVLYLSLYFKTHQSRYYELLNEVRETGDWESWLDFFFNAVNFTTQQTIKTTQAVLFLSKQDQSVIQSNFTRYDKALIVYQQILIFPVITVKMLSQNLSLSKHIISKLLNKFVILELIESIPGKNKQKVYYHKRYLDQLNKQG